MATEVWILESLRKDDHKTGTLLKQAILAHAPSSGRSVKVQLRQPFDRADFFANLAEVVESAANGHFPILHFEAHGDEECLQLADNSLVYWSDLSAPLIELNDKLRGNLIVTVAACSGAYMAKTALHAVRSPFLAVMGPSTPISAGDLVADYTNFFFEFDKTRSVVKARWALNAFKTHTQEYFFTTAQSIFTQAHQDRLSKGISEDEVNQKAERVLKKMQTSDPSLDVISTRNGLRRIFADPNYLARETWKIFMFIDKYEDNDTIFEFPFDLEPS